VAMRWTKRTYATTPFGAAVLAEARQTMGFRDAMTRWFATPASKAWLAERIATARPPEATASGTEGGRAR
jgi:hypothetical protein